jgi:hypothetical protein
MKSLLAIPLLILPLAAQEQPAEQAPAQEAAAPVSPSPITEKRVTGSMDIGYRWVSDVSGNFNTYRSVVDLGEGPKLFGLDFTIEDPSHRLFDKLTASGNNWGGDPYNTARVDVERRGVYRFLFDYRNIAYFNFLPSFANPGIAQGSFLNQNSFDIHHRFTNAELELRPGKRVTPYLAYSRDSGFGRGITPFVSTGNEYPVATDLRNKTDNYRGGLRLEMNRFQATFEQGGTTFKDDQRVFTNERNSGNRTTPLFDQRLFLSNLEQAYGVRGDSIYSKALFTAAPAAWADLYAQFLYSQPTTNTHYTGDARGLLYLGLTRFFDTQQDLLSAEAKQPHTSGAVSAELRPHRRIRIMESWTTDRFHNATSALLTEQLFFATDPAQIESMFSADRLVLNYNRQQVDAFFDVTSKITLRGGHRYVWGDALVRPSSLSPTGQPEAGELRRHVGLGGVNVRTQRLRVNVDYEGSSGDRAYFRTSLQDYQQVRIQGRYQLFPSLLLTANYLLLNNENPTPGINYDFQSRAGTFSVFWTPGSGKRVSLLGDYTRSTLRSDIQFFTPDTRTLERSFYRDNAHTATALLDVNLPAATQVIIPKISIGGSLFVSSGSRPSRYYQPIGRFVLPLSQRVQWYAEWRWYGFSQAFYMFEGFRTHHLMTGLRLNL